LERGYVLFGALAEALFQRNNSLVEHYLPFTKRSYRNASCFFAFSTNQKSLRDLAQFKEINQIRGMVLDGMIISLNLFRIQQ